jgi:hypothetical protein
VNIKKAEAIIDYVVLTTKPLWERWINLSYADLDEIFLQSAYEQGGFAATAFYMLMGEEGIASIEDVGLILKDYKGEKKYSRVEKGSLENAFYKDLKTGLYDQNGKAFYKCVHRFLGEKWGNPGSKFWSNLWHMLICCRHLKQHYNSSFKYYLRKRYSDYRGISLLSDDDFCNISNNEWEAFKKDVFPWDELYGIGENVFDYLVRNIKEFKFSADSFKLDSANMRFFNVTGISHLFDYENRESILKFLKGLKLQNNYTLREINTGIYSYCSDTERKNFGFCQKPERCIDCGVNSICEKNI